MFKSQTSPVTSFHINLLIICLLCNRPNFETGWPFFHCLRNITEKKKGEVACVTSDHIVWDLTQPRRKSICPNCNENYLCHIEWQIFLWLECIQGFYSLSWRTSYRKISWSIEAARFGFSPFQSRWIWQAPWQQRCRDASQIWKWYDHHLTSNLAAWGLHEILR